MVCRRVISSTSTNGCRSHLVPYESQERGKMDYHVLHLKERRRGNVTAHERCASYCERVLRNAPL